MQKNFEVEILKECDLDEWVAHCGSIFSVGPDYFRRHFEKDPHRDINSVFIIKDNGKIISTVRVFHREIYIQGIAYKMGGIGEVSTNKDYRGLGLSHKLLDYAVKYMESSGFIVSMLSASLFDHYAKHGYVKLKHFTASLTKVQAELPRGFYLRELTSSDYPAMSVLYDNFVSQKNCAVVRNMDYWQSWCAGELKNPTGLFKDGVLAGYICHKGNYITEIAGGSEYHQLLISAVKTDKDTIVAPACICPSLQNGSTKANDGWMIRTFGQVCTESNVFDNSRQLADYIDSTGGVTLWNTDDF